MTITSRVVVNHTMTADGYTAGIDQTEERGANTINQYLAAGLVDELRLHVVPFTLGAGARLFEGVPPLDLEQVYSRAASTVIHLTYRVLR